MVVIISFFAPARRRPGRLIWIGFETRAILRAALLKQTWKGSCGKEFDAKRSAAPMSGVIAKQFRRVRAERSKERARQNCAKQTRGGLGHWGLRVSPSRSII
jgi:hypothetical protein